MERSTREAQVLELLREAEVIRPRDLAAHGIPREHLRRMLERGLVERVGRGLYVLPNSPVGARQSLAEAAKRVPHGVICLLSALSFHELTTQNPRMVWMAIDQKAWRTQATLPPMRFVFLSGRAFTEGVEHHHISGGNVAVFGSAKTVADCFKFRNKVGLDVAIEALRDYRRLRKGSTDELWRYAKICRVANVMRPYMESIL